MSKPWPRLPWWPWVVVGAAVLLGLAGGVWALYGNAPSRAAALATPQPTLAPSPTGEATTPTAGPTCTETATITPSPSATPTATPSPTFTLSATPTPSPTATPIPWPTPDGVARTLRVPILMYHYLSTPPAGADAIRRDLSVSPERFEEQLRYLREAGYTSISLHDLALALEIGWPLPPKPIILTFDDGYRDAYTEALPLLQRYGFTATFFLITAPIDQDHPEYLTWDQVREMAQAGMSIEAHGYTHMDLRGKPVDYIIWQVLGSKEAIESRTGKTVRFFCYPSGQYDEPVVRVLRSAHYWGAVTVKTGVEQRSGHLFELERLRIRGGYDLAAFVNLLQTFMAEP